MKAFTKLIGMCTLFIVLGSGCKKEDCAVVAVDNGNWRVSYFSDGGNDKTSHFSGYTFRFDRGGKAVASNSSGTVNGSWTCGNDDNRLEFRLNFSSPPLNELNQDWEIVDQTIKVVQLRHLSGGSGGSDFLTFQKK